MELLCIFQHSILHGYAKRRDIRPAMDRYKDGYISITKSIAQKLKGGDRITPPKNKPSIRTIQIPEPLRAVLSEHYERCKKAVPKFSDDMYICGGERPIRDTSLEKTNKKFADLAGVKRIRIHDFRHSHASCSPMRA